MPNLQWHTCYVYIRYSYVKHSPFYQHPYRQIYEKRRYRWLHSRKVSHTQRTQTVSKWLMFYAPNSLWILNMMICRFVLNIYSLLFGYFLMAYFFPGTRLLVWLESFFKVRIDHNIFFVCSHVPWTPTESENILDLKKQKKKIWLVTWWATAGLGFGIRLCVTHAWLFTLLPFRYYMPFTSSQCQPQSMVKNHSHVETLRAETGNVSTSFPEDLPIPLATSATERPKLSLIIRIWKIISPLNLKSACRNGDHICRQSSSTMPQHQFH